MLKYNALQQEVAELKAKLAEAEETLNAIRLGEVDALVTSGPDGDRIFTLQGAETPYRILIEEMNQGALMILADGDLFYANARFADLTKTPLEKVIGSSWRQFFPSDHHPQLKDFLEKSNTHTTEEMKLLAADGSFTPVQLSIRSMSAEGVSGYSVIVTDLTERKKSEAALQRKSDELSEKNQHLEEFSSSVSHDIRAPLRSMEGFAKILLEDYGDKVDSLGRSYLQRIVTSAKDLNQLIHDVLDYSRLSRSEEVMTTFDLDQTVREIVENFPNLRAANIQILTTPIFIRGASVPLAQSISNLLGNAVKFVAKDRQTQVKVWSESLNGHVRLWVEDNGIGIPLEFQEKIFDIFTRLHPAHEYEGTGIGLSMVQKAAEKMGGTVGVISEPGIGSKFWIEFEKAESKN